MYLKQKKKKKTVPLISETNVYAYDRLPDVDDGVYQGAQSTAANRGGQTVPRVREAATSSAPVQREAVRGAVSYERIPGVPQTVV